MIRLVVSGATGNEQIQKSYFVMSQLWGVKNKSNIYDRLVCERLSGIIGCTPRRGGSEVKVV